MHLMGTMRRTRMSDPAEMKFEGASEAAERWLVFVGFATMG